MENVYRLLRFFFLFFILKFWHTQADYCYLLITNFRFCQNCFYTRKSLVWKISSSRPQQGLMGQLVSCWLKRQQILVRRRYCLFGCFQTNREKIWSHRSLGHSYWSIQSKVIILKPFQNEKGQKRYPTKKQPFSKEKDCFFVGYLKSVWPFLI